MSQELISRLAEFRNAFDRLEANVTAAARRDDESQRYQDFVRSATDWVWETDARLNLTFVSDGIVRAFGVPGQVLIGSYIFALNRFKQVGDSLLDLVEAMEAHRPFRNSSITVTAQDGVEHTVLLSGVPVFSNADGAFAGYRGTGNDPAHAANRELRVVPAETADIVPLTEAGREPAAVPAFDETGELFRRAADAADLAGWEWDLSNDGFRFAGGISRRLGLNEADATIECWYRRIHPEDLMRVKEAFRRHVSGQTPRIDVEHRLLDSDGLVFWVVTRGMASRATPDAALRVFGASTDVTRRIQAEDTQRSARETAETASRAKSAFLTHLSHELRTPLNAIIGFSEALKDDVFGPLTPHKAKEYSGDIYEAGHHLLQLIDDILDLSRVEAGEMVLDEAEIDVEHAVRAALRLIEGRAEGKTISLNAVFGGDLPHLFADERVIKQVALNLLSNAVKFTPDGGVVSVRAVQRGDGGVRLEVSDTGVGISEEDLPKVLTPFGRVTGDLSVTPEGVGLGLPLSKSLIELHGGTLELRSARGCGTDAVVDFPAERSLVIQAAAVGGTA